jgi:hypothetical protein
MFGIPAILKLANRPSFAASVGLVYSAKIGACLLLAAMQLLQLLVIYNNPTSLSKMISHSIGFVSYLFAGVFHHYDHFYSRISSSTLLFFWLLSVVSQVISLRTSYLLDFPTQFILLFAFQCGSLFITSFAFVMFLIPKPLDYYQSLDDTQNTSPEGTANIFSLLIFHWMDPLMKLGSSKNLVMEDLWDLKKSDSAAFNSETFQRCWTNQLKRKNPSLLAAILISFGPALISSGLFKFIQDLLGKY